jgi:hypothetical protein
VSEIGAHGWGNVQDIEQFIERNSSFIGQTGNRSIGFRGEYCFFPLLCERDFIRAYNECSPLKSIIGRRSKAFNSGVLQVVNESTGKEVKSGNAGSTRKLLKKPNVLQTESQYFAQQNTYIDLHGYCPVLKVHPAGMPAEISSLWNMPPWLFDLEYTQNWLKQTRIDGIFKNFKLNWHGTPIEIPFNDLFFVFDDGIGTQMDSNLLIPDSRLVGLDYEVSNIVAAYKSRNTLITKRGAIGVLSNGNEDHDGSVPLKPGEKEELQKEFSTYGITGQAYQVIITDANLKWQQMGFATKELMLFEEIEDNINRMCDAYGTPSVLMAQTEGSTYENQSEARKDFITNTIIPENCSRMEMFTIGIFGLDSGFAIIRDYSKLAVLQEDKAKAAKARLDLDTALQTEYLKGIITKNDWREKLGEERIEDPSFDEYYDEIAAEERATQAQVAVATARGGAARGRAAA